MSSEQRSPTLSDLPADDHLLAFVDSILARSATDGVVRGSESKAYLTFVLGESRFAIPMGCCREIARLGEIARVPDAPSQVRGVVNLRGRVVPVLELRLRVGLAPAVVTPRSRLVVVEARGRLFGLLVDRVLGISKIPVADIDTVPGASFGEGQAGRARLGEDVVLLVDPDRILAPERGGKP
jgi:purine-binding chemotaxis protein CheW